MIPGAGPGLILAFIDEDEPYKDSGLPQPRKNWQVEMFQAMPSTDYQMPAAVGTGKGPRSVY